MMTQKSSQNKKCRIEENIEYTDFDLNKNLNLNLIWIVLLVNLNKVANVLVK